MRAIIILPMHPVVQSFLFMLTTLRGCIARLRFLDMCSGERPSFAMGFAARRLRAGLRFLQAYARRLLVLMALALEPSLVDVRKPLRRPRWRKKSVSKSPSFVIFRPYVTDAALDRLQALTRDKSDDKDKKPKPIALDKLYARLDHLAKIAADPMARAKRLAFHLARFRHGPMFSTDLYMRAPGFWGTEASATFDAMAYDISEKSRNRPPPLPPPQRMGPTVTVLECVSLPWKLYAI